MIKNIIKKLTGAYIFRKLPRGIDLILDIKNSLPEYHVKTIFDIGANIGQLSIYYLNHFPNSHIYCFEPVRDTFRQLQENLRGNKRADCYRLAFGSTNGTGEMVLQGTSDLYFLSGQSKNLKKNTDSLTESVDILTLDKFCQMNNIDHINHLKIDTEGGDLDVLKGSEYMLTEQKIDLVEVEAGMNSNNKRHVPFEALKEFLELHEYFLFGIYEQFEERITGESHLRRANLLFISRRMIDKNKKPVEDKKV